MDDLNFCPSCGKNLDHGATYCPACGTHLSDPGAKSVEKEIEIRAGNDRTKVAAALIFLYSVPLVLIGIYLYVIAQEVVDMIFTDPAYADSLAMLIDLGYTEASFMSIMTWVAAVPMIAGAIGLVAGALALMRKAYTLTMILCLVSAVIGALIIFPLAL
ncbi:MAG: zinc-ribbon domain-containing protein, partial [Methanomassiliicoccaceae archaeon]|nr:zinc-ribbon domain-containing protein [Methanomassiliicoccaceae archaeon]